MQSLSEQIAQLEQELEGYRDGTEIKELQDQIQILESENRDYREELNEIEDNADKAADTKASMLRIESYIFDLEDAHSSIQDELRKL
jgi:predicted  nucleic acid-binding Zn-ribbon protein